MDPPERGRRGEGAQGGAALVRRRKYIGAVAADTVFRFRLRQPFTVSVECNEHGLRIPCMPGGVMSCAAGLNHVSLRHRSRLFEHRHCDPRCVEDFTRYRTHDNGTDDDTRPAHTHDNAITPGCLGVNNN